MTPASNLKSATNDEEWEVKVEPFPETYSFENPGDMLVGTYTHSKTIEQEGLDGNPREVTIYTLEDSNGKKWGVWESWAISEAFKTIQKGDLVRVIYEGTEKIDNGARTVKKFNVASKKV